MDCPRKCLECGTILHGRSDKKFCGDLCRNTFNNRQQGPLNNTVRRINRILKKNQSLLATLLRSGKTVVPRCDLLDGEFNFTYFTNLRTDRRGRTCYFCYDQGYLPLNGNKVLLVSKQNELQPR